MGVCVCVRVCVCLFAYVLAYIVCVTILAPFLAIFTPKAVSGRYTAVYKFECCLLRALSEENSRFRDEEGSISLTLLTCHVCHVSFGLTFLFAAGR